MGKINGMLQLESIDNLAVQLLLVVAAQDDDDPYRPTKEQFLDALWTLTALLICTEGV